MLKKILLALLFVPALSYGQTAVLPIYWCSLPGTRASVSGLKSSNYQLGIIPSCTVSVYLTGTTTLATTTPQSPFTANIDGSISPIYAAVNQGYDVVLSGGIAPNVYPSPVTLTGLYPGSDITIPAQGCLGQNAIANGCTGATTAAGIWANITGGVQTGSGTGQVNTLPGELDANINGIYAVTTYGAVGDCTGSGSNASCTDNHAAIQAAINAAYAVGGSVYIPTNPSASGQTVYYTRLPIDPKGVSIFGPPGANGAAQNFASQARVVIRGAPGKDVFNGPDPTSGAYVAWLPGYTVRDLTILFDDTVDVSASNIYRRPGRTLGDAVMTSGSAVLTSASAIFQGGDVGQAVTVTGAGTSGANLTTTIASIQSKTQVTLSANASTAVTGANLYISVMNLPVTQNIGNCGWAVEDKLGNGNAGGASGNFYNVNVQGIDAGINNSCGYMFQGQRFVYDSRWQDGFASGEFAFAFIPAPAPPCITGSGCTISWSGMGDTNVWDKIWIAGTYPFLAYDGEINRFMPSQISNAAFGPHILSTSGIRSSPLYWDIWIGELETNPATCGSGDIAFRASGENMHVGRLEISGCSGSIFQWDANDSTVDGIGTSQAVTTINISGTLNDFSSEYDSDYFTSATQNITGYGNRFFTKQTSNTPSGVQAGRPQIGGVSPGTPLLSRPAYAFARTHDFIDKGATSYYYNGEDLWWWPSEIAQLGVTPNRVLDPTSDSGLVYQETTQTNFNSVNNSSVIIGKGIPAGKIRIYIKAKANTSLTNAFYAYAGATPLSGSVNASLTTSFQVFSFDTDTTSYSGQQFIFISGGFGTPSPAGTVSIAWIALRPWVNDEPVNSLQIGSGTAMTDNTGNGSAILHSDGTSGLGDIITFDANGNATDSMLGTDNLPNYCGQATFSSSTTSSVVSCPWVATSSHCAATWTGSTVTGGALGFTASSGSVQLRAATSNSGSASVFCSVN